MKLRGTVAVLGDYISGDAILPARYAFLDPEAIPDFSYSHDFAVFAIDAFERMGAARVVHPDRVAICLDHIVPAAAWRPSIRPCGPARDEDIQLPSS